MPGILSTWEDGQFPSGIRPMPEEVLAMLFQVIKDTKWASEVLISNTSSIDVILKVLIGDAVLLDQAQQECTNEAAFFSQQDLEKVHIRLEDCIYDLKKPYPDLVELSDVLDDIHTDILAIIDNNTTNEES